MTTEFGPNAPAPQSPGETASQEDAEHLKRLRRLVEAAIADGKLSNTEMNDIRAALFADGKLTLAEMEVVRDTMKAHLGEKPLEFEPE